MSALQESQPGRAVATAQPNIALIKYWGKRDEELIVPVTGSLSLTLDVFPTITTVDVDEAGQLQHDEIIFDGAPATGVKAERISEFLELVREMSGTSTRARVETQNSVPTAAGLASSASGFAALAVAASAAYGLDLSRRDLSRLARRGSGSACRSIFGGSVLWNRGSDDATSYAEEIAGPDLAMLVLVLDNREKPISSREAMRLSRDTSPYYSAWISENEKNLDEMRRAFAAKDFQRIGELTELSALRMHAAIQASRPPLRYLSPQSIAMFDLAETLRAEGIETYATADAGPNVVFLCRDADLEELRAEVLKRTALSGEKVIAARAGRGARLIGDD